MTAEHVSSLVTGKHTLRCLLPELLADRTKISVWNVQRHVINVKNERLSWSSACGYSKSWNIKANPEAELATSVCDANHLRNWTKMSSWSVQMFNAPFFKIYTSMFSMDNDPLHFAFTLLNREMLQLQCQLMLLAVFLVQCTTCMSVLDEAIWFLEILLFLMNHFSIS